MNSMRYMSAWILALALMATASCKKSSTAAPSYPGGSWTMNNVTFYATTCLAGSPGLTASDTLTGSPSCNIIVNFFDSLPTVGGSYTVSGLSTPDAPGQVSVSVGYVAPGVLNNYASTGGNGMQKVQVSVSNGKLHISGTGIEMINTGLGSDSTALDFSISQTQ